MHQDSFNYFSSLVVVIYRGVLYYNIGVFQLCIVIVSNIRFFGDPCVVTGISTNHLSYCSSGDPMHQDSFNYFSSLVVVIYRGVLYYNIGVFQLCIVIVSIIRFFGDPCVVTGISTNHFSYCSSGDPMHQDSFNYLSSLVVVLYRGVLYYNIGVFQLL